ncbi:MAG: three-Cys-motif partner protein TcmP [Victivallales bacterium]|nr:three-Cys-motif partner protein TcmP [Victivallales bacterium]
MTKDMHQKAFEEHTLDKLSIYEKYLKSALPLFMMRPDINQINIMDYFCGSGTDVNGVPGSPLRAIEAVRSTLLSEQIDRKKKIVMLFNDLEKDKIAKLNDMLKNIENLPNNVELQYESKPFDDLFDKTYCMLNARGTANVIFIDQYGLSEVTRDIFERLARLDNTDFLFFLSSATYYRFKDDENVKNKIPVLTDVENASLTPSNVHRTIALAYKRWIPTGRMLYMGNFSLKHGANVYGLVFGSGHFAGLDKFLHVAWESNPETAGQADYDIDSDKISLSQPSLFASMNKPTKLKMFEQDLCEEIKARKLQDNKSIYLYSLEYGVLPSHVQDALKTLISEGILPQQRFSVSKTCMKKPSVKIIWSK